MRKLELLLRRLERTDANEGLRKLRTVLEKRSKPLTFAPASQLNDEIAALTDAIEALADERDRLADQLTVARRL
jgi:hypothetical protein